MSAHIGPRLKIARAIGIDLPGLTRKSIENRNYPPGQHGARQRKKSDFGIKLIEKQKLRFNYGVSEKQIRRLFREAKADKSPTGNKLLELLERRLDNAVFRAGFAPTCVAARQLIGHRHVLLNGRSVNVASIRIRSGDSIRLADRATKIPMVVDSLRAPALTRPEWIRFDELAVVATIARLPEASEVPIPVDVQHVVEYYAVRI